MSVPWESCGEMPTFHQQQECADRAMDRNWQRYFDQTTADFNADIASQRYQTPGLGHMSGMERSTKIVVYGATGAAAGFILSKIGKDSEENQGKSLLVGGLIGLFAAIFSD